jgi:hypothetical protein
VHAAKAFLSVHQALPRFRLHPPGRQLPVAAWRSEFPPEFPIFTSFARTTTTTLKFAQIVATEKVALRPPALAKAPDQKQGKNRAQIQTFAPVFCIWMLAFSTYSLRSKFDISDGTSWLGYLETILP